jgi:hypothetical protein
VHLSRRAIEAAENLKRKHPHSVAVKDLQTGEVTAVENQPEGLGQGGPVFQPPAFAPSHAARNFAIASSRVAAVPFVTPVTAGTIAVIDQSGGPKREPLRGCGRRPGHRRVRHSLRASTRRKSERRTRV